MNRVAWQRIFPQILAWTALFVLCTALALAQSAAQASGQRTDGQIEMDVVHALDGSQPLKNDLITAATIQGEVTLSGTVALESSKALAEQIVKGVPGVTAVHDNLKVGNPANDPNAQNGPMVDSNDAIAPETGTPAPYSSSEPQVTNPGYERQSPAPQYGQTSPPAYGQNPPPQYGQNQNQNYGQNPANGQSPNYGYGQNRYPNYGQNQYPGYGQNGYGQQPYRQQYAPQRQQYQIPSGPVTVGAGTLIEVRTSEAVSSKHAAQGTPVQFTVIRDVTTGGALAIPRGATVHGVVTEIHQAGQLSGSSELALQLTELDLAGRTYPIQSDSFRVKGPSKTGRTVGNVVGGALVGALIGGVAGGGGGAAIGAAAGGTLGTAASAAEHGPNAWIPSEALVTFHLAEPVTVSPVSQEEADRLAQGLNQGGPRLQQRGYYAQPYGYAYPFAPVYYRPYYYTGGFYYWR